MKMISDTIGQIVIGTTNIKRSITIFLDVVIVVFFAVFFLKISFSRAISILSEGGGIHDPPSKNFKPANDQN